MGDLSNSEGKGATLYASKRVNTPGNMVIEVPRKCPYRSKWERNAASSRDKDFSDTHLRFRIGYENMARKTSSTLIFRVRRSHRIVEVAEYI